MSKLKHHLTTPLTHTSQRRSARMVGCLSESIVDIPYQFLKLNQQIFSERNPRKWCFIIRSWHDTALACLCLSKRIWKIRNIFLLWLQNLCRHLFALYITHHLDKIQVKMKNTWDPEIFKCFVPKFKSAFYNYVSINTIEIGIGKVFWTIANFVCVTIKVDSSWLKYSPVVILLFVINLDFRVIKMSKNLNCYGQLCADEKCSFQPWKPHTHRNQ